MNQDPSGGALHEMEPTQISISLGTNLEKLVGGHMVPAEINLVEFFWMLFSRNLMTRVIENNNNNKSTTGFGESIM